MLLNIIFTKMKVKKKNNAIKEYKQVQHIADILEKNKLKHNDMMLRHYY
ncbi:hypothetical protein [Heyndrickxia camelliae]|nr:hypothetical protein [Heyndrickxia camelliae]